MNDSEKSKAEKTNTELQYSPNNPEPTEIKIPKKNQSHDSFEAISEYVNRDKY